MRDLISELHKFEYEYVTEALVACDGGRSATARYLTITPHQLDWRMKRHGLEYDDFKPKCPISVKLRNWR